MAAGLAAGFAAAAGAALAAGAAAAAGFAAAAAGFCPGLLAILVVNALSYDQIDCCSKGNS